uniref:NADH-ubiquinone oxidoreductase chain 1 n=1 Tax=Arthonia susa TaxID=2488734 RepID=A0A3Q9CSV4_9PEZI|nr:NADH dehydrogenase subunit 1 [Arthonia susa]
MFLSILISILECIIITIPVLLMVAFLTVTERKTMASMQRRIGPNVVGYYGLLQAFADALKLLLKEYVSPTQANIILFFIGPIITLIFSLLGYAVIPFAPGLSIFDFNLGILFLLAVSSLATYGILLAGWSANSKYAFLGSLRSTAQLISYELVISSAIFLVILLTSSFNLTANIEAQKSVWLLAPLFPIFIIFFISGIAETNRAPFDLAEAESELVSGFMTEHSAVVFVFFFLAEYANIVLICLFITIIFIGGYNIDIENLIDIINFIPDIISNIYSLLINLTYYTLDIGLLQFKHYNLHIEYTHFNPVIEDLISNFSLGVKAVIMIFVFIWVRASFPRIRYDQLMSYCWTVLLPIVFAFIILMPCILYVFKIIPNNVLFFS